MSEESRPSSKKKYLRLIWLAPLAVVLIVLYINFLPLGGSPSHTIDVGGGDTGGKARLAEPMDGFSEAMSNGSVTYREITGDTVYFELTDPRLSQADEIAVAVRFADNFPDDGIFIFGARGGDGYSLRYAYVPFYAQLRDLPLVTRNGSLLVYATDTENEPPLSAVMDPLRNPPLGSLIASGDPTLDINRRITPQEYLNMMFDTFKAEGELASLLPASKYYSRLDSDLVLPGAQRFYLYSNGGRFEIAVEKRDLNRIAGLDNIDVSLYAPDGTLAASETIWDDFNFSNNSVMGPRQSLNIVLPDSASGVYRLEIASQRGDEDFIITNLATSHGKMITDGPLYLAGNTYIGKQQRSIFVWCYLAAPGEIRFSAPEAGTPQMAAVSRGDFRMEINVNESDVWYSTGPLEPGLYRFKSGKGDIILDAPGACMAFTPDSLFIPSFNSIGEGRGWLDIKTSLRGGHTLWTYVDNGALELAVTASASDGAKIELYDLDGVLMAETAMARGSGPSPTTLTASNLSTGAYRIEITGQDLLISGIGIDKGKLVLDDRIAPAPADGGCNAGIPADALVLYTQGLSLQRAEFTALDASGLQQVAICGDGSYTELNIDEINEPAAVDLAPGSYQFIIPRQNLTLEFNGYMSFTTDSFFLPNRCEVAGLEAYVSDFKPYVDYIAVTYDDYFVTTSYDGWHTARARWKTSDLTIVDNTLSFCLMVPHLDLAADAGKTIPIDSITIELEIPPFWK